MGCIYQKRKGERILGWYCAYVDRDGKRRHVATRQRTRAAAQVFLAEIEAKVRRGLVGVPERRVAPTVAELAAQWLSARGGPKAERRRCLAQACLKRVLPSLGSLPVDRLTRAHLTRAIAELSQRYAANTTRSTIETLSAVLGHAVQEGLLPANPARCLPQPRREVAVEWLERAEAGRLLALLERRSADSPRDGVRLVAVALALLAGLRRGEVFGLRWRDVDLERRSLTVARSYSGTTKSGQARHLPLDDELHGVLRAWRPRCPQTTEGLVCPCRHGNAWEMAGARYDHGLRQLLAEAGCKPLRRGWHALRHSFASLYVQAGGDLYSLSRLLGHATVAQTEVYAHLGPDFLAAARARLRLRG